MTDPRDIESFLYQEADFLDRADLDGWFELYTKDASYWMPVSPEQTDPHNHISLFYDDHLMMEIRRPKFRASVSRLYGVSHCAARISSATFELKKTLKRP